jgi:hypothetical protein
MNENEAKVVATDRLRQEGRWEAFCKRRDEVREQLQKAGKGRKEAAAEAWRVALREYPPLIDSDLPTEPLAGIDDTAPDLVADVLWVYAHLEDAGATAAAAPSRGAWALLKHARQYRTQFFEKMLPRAIAANEKREAETAGEAEDGGLEALETMIKNARRAHEVDLAANAPVVVRRDVLASLSDWQRFYSIELPPNAAASLSDRLVGYVGKALAILRRE